MTGLNASETQLLLNKVREIDAFRNYGVAYSMNGKSAVIAAPISPITSGIMFYSTSTMSHYNSGSNTPQSLPTQPQTRGTVALNIAINCGGAAIAMAATGASGGALTPLTAIGGSIASFQCAMSIGRLINFAGSQDDSVFDSIEATRINYALEALGWICGIGELRLVFKTAQMASRYPLLRRMVVNVEMTRTTGSAHRTAMRNFLNGLTIAEKRALGLELRTLTRSSNPSDNFRVLISSRQFRREINALVHGGTATGAMSGLRSLEHYVRGKVRELSLAISGIFVSSVGSLNGGIAGGILEWVSNNRTLYIHFYDTEGRN